jgi:3',5'-cyclic AMP phosphodiesterase CpdA
VSRHRAPHTHRVHGPGPKLVAPAGIHHISVMLPRTVRAALATSAIGLAVLAGGCGGIDEGPAVRQDASFTGDRPIAQPDAQSAGADVPAAIDAAAARPDLGLVDAQATDADSPATVDAGVRETDGQVAALDATVDAGGPPDTPPPPPATIIVLPDTQYYSAAYPDVYLQQTRWIVDQKRALHIEAVLHVGDLVDGFDDAEQWSSAGAAMRVLDGVVPYVIVPGNHDTDASRETPINTYFGPDSLPWLGGTMTAGRIENNYALIAIGAQRWLVVGIEFGPRDSVVAWADSVLKAYPSLPAILVTHAYLYRDGSRYDINVSRVSQQYFIPQDYGYTASEGINDGEMMWQRLVLPNPNVRMVFSGHDSAAARLTSARPDGSLVHQMLSDYQWYGGVYFGYGYLRIVRLDYAQRTISVETYSPYLREHLTDDANQFTLEWNL